MRATWSGSIALGSDPLDPQFPVSAYKAVGDDPKSVSFKQMCACGSTTHEVIMCDAEKKAVDKATMLKGYALGKDKFLTFTKEEIQAFEEESDRTFRVTGWKDARDVDPLRLSNSFYLAPEDSAADKLFAIVRETLRANDKAAVGLITVYKRTRLAALMAHGAGLILHLLASASQLRKIEDVDKLTGVPAEVQPAHIAKVAGLFEALTETSDVDEENYTDAYTESVSTLVQNRLAGVKLDTVEVKPKSAVKVVDIDATLDAALNAVKSRPKLAAVKTAAPAKAAAKATKKAKAA